MQKQQKVKKLMNTAVKQMQKAIEATLQTVL